MYKSICFTYSNTGLPAYSDSAGTTEKCYCKGVSLYPMIFSIRRSFFGLKNCHCSQSVTLTGVTVSGEAFIFISIGVLFNKSFFCIYGLHDIFFWKSCGHYIRHALYLKTWESMKLPSSDSCLMNCATATPGTSTRTTTAASSSTASKSRQTISTLR